MTKKENEDKEEFYFIRGGAISEPSKKTGKNEKCPCGSGIKYKRCCMNKIPRNQHIYIGHKEKFSGVSITDNGEVSIFADDKEIIPDIVSTQVEYKNKKNRVMSSIPGLAVTNIQKYLIDNFDIIYAIDTNTKPIENKSISVCSVSQSFFRNHNKLEGKALFYFRKLGNILFKNCPKDFEEKFSWVKFIELLPLVHKEDSKKLKFCIITDHNSGLIDKYNNRELPLIENFYLPDNFTMLYARAGKEKQDLRNMLISNCENDAKKMLREFEEKKFINFNNRNISIDDIYDFPKVIYLLGE